MTLYAVAASLTAMGMPDGRCETASGHAF